MWDPSLEVTVYSFLYETVLFFVWQLNQPLQAQIKTEGDLQENPQISKRQEDRGRPWWKNGAFFLLTGGQVLPVIPTEKTNMTQWNIH